MFREAKATAIASFFVDKVGTNQINDIDLMKLTVFAERICLEEHTSTMTGDKFVNMPFGPVLSRMYNCMKNGKIEPTWNEHFEPMDADYMIRRKRPYDFKSVLAEWEIELLEKIWGLHGESIKWDKVRYAHSPQVPEWKRPEPPARAETLDLTRIFNVGLKDDIETAIAKANLIANVEGARRKFQ